MSERYYLEDQYSDKGVYFFLRYLDPIEKSTVEAELYSRYSELCTNDYNLNMRIKKLERLYNQCETMPSTADYFKSEIAKLSIEINENMNRITSLELDNRIQTLYVKLLNIAKTNENKDLEELVSNKINSLPSLVMQNTYNQNTRSYVSKEAIQKAIVEEEKIAKRSAPKAPNTSNNKTLRDRLDKLETRLSIIKLVAIALCIILIFSLNWLSESVFSHQVLKEYTTQEPYEYISGVVLTYVCYTTTYGASYHADYCGYLWNSSHKTTVYEAEQSGYAPCSKCTPYQKTEITLKNYGVKEIRHTEWETKPASKFPIWLLGTGGVGLFYFLSTVCIKRKINALRKSTELS